MAAEEKRNREIIGYNFFTRKWQELSETDRSVNPALAHAVAAGIMGNLYHESAGLLTTAEGDKGVVAGNSHGLAQWNRGRWDAMKNYAKSKGVKHTDYQTQLEFVWQELTTTHRGALDDLKTVSNVQDAAVSFNKYYEVSADSRQPITNTHTQRRIAHAQRIGGNDYQGIDMSDYTYNSEVDLNYNSEAYNVDNLHLTPEQGLLAGDYQKQLWSVLYPHIEFTPENYDTYVGLYPNAPHVGGEKEGAEQEVEESPTVKALKALNNERQFLFAMRKQIGLPTIERNTNRQII